MTKPDQLLKTKSDFEKQRFKKLYSDNLLRLRVANDRQNNFRFGFIIPKKVIAKVTDRNKIKRRLKVILLRFEKNIRPADLLFFPNTQSTKARFSDLGLATKNLLIKANLWKQ